MELVLRAAIKSEENGTIYSVPAPKRHHDVIALMVREGLNTPILGEQGFMVGNDWDFSQQRFVDRIEAKRIAMAAGQILPGSLDLEELFSENLW